MNSIADIKEKLLKETTIHPIFGCWLYRNERSKIRYKGKKVWVHRLSAHIHWNFDLNSDKLILHKVTCSHPNCWNPDHLYEGTQKDNMQDAVLLATHNFVTMKRPDMCKYGHPLDGMRGNGKRYCLTCNRIRVRGHV